MKKYSLLLLGIFITTVQAHSQGVLLDGKWKYNFTDQKTYADAGFDDSGWKEISGKLSWTMDDLPKESPIVWLRKTVIIPSSLKKELNKTGALAFFIGQTDQTYDAFFNGTLVGTIKSGDTKKGYLVNPTEIKWDKENTFAIRMKHWWSYNTIEGTPEFAAAPPAQMFVFTVGAVRGIFLALYKYEVERNYHRVKRKELKRREEA